MHSPKVKAFCLAAILGITTIFTSLVYADGPGDSSFVQLEEINDASVASSSENENNKENEQVKNGTSEESDINTSSTAAESEDGDDKTPDENPEKTEESTDEDRVTGSQESTDVIGEEKDVRNSIVRIITGYEFDDGSFDQWTDGFGFLIGKDCLITPRNSAVIEQDSQAYRNIISSRGEQYLNNLGINLKDYASIEKNVHTYVITSNGQVEASINTDAVGDSFVVLQLEDRINSKTTAVLSDSALNNGDTVYAVGTESDKEVFSKEDFFGRKSSVTGVRKNGTSEYVEFEGSFGTLSPGCPLIDENFRVVGLITDGNAGRGSAVDIKTIEDALDMANIEYDVEKSQTAQTQPDDLDVEPSEEPVAPVQDADVSIEKLQELLDQANNLDRSAYTEESLEAVDTAAAAGQTVASDENASKNRIEKAIIPLQEALNNLQEKDHSDMYVSLAILAVVVIGLVVGGLILSQKLRDRGKEDWQLEEEREARIAAKKAKKEAKKKPAKKEKPMKQKKAPNKKPTHKKPKNELEDAMMEGFDDIDNGTNEETALLEEDGATGVLNDSEYKRAWLISKRDGRQIDISKNSFQIGKEAGTADYRINKDTISRRHCRILRRGSDFYVEDLGSKNGTYIDGSRIQKGDQKPIRDGQELMLSDETFVFQQEL